MITYIISTIAIIISVISLFMNYRANKNNDRNRDVERYVLHYRDKIRDILEELRITYKSKNGHDVNREKCEPLIDNLKFHIHDIKFFDKKYDTKIHENLLNIINEYETKILKSEEMIQENYINRIKEILLSTD